jgi:hypothetical protein
MHTSVLFGTFVDNSGNDEFRISAVEWTFGSQLAEAVALISHSFQKEPDDRCDSPEQQR